jgi:hypothetical protein
MYGERQKQMIKTLLLSFVEAANIVSKNLRDSICFFVVILVLYPKYDVHVYFLDGYNTENKFR